jgi:collagenase-like PrtC family protease
MNVAPAPLRFAVGYQLPEPDEEPLTQIVAEFRDRLAEVYFPWLDMPSGRSPMSARGGEVQWDAQQVLERDLHALKGLGLKLNLLFNANCYGGQALSQALHSRVCSIVAHLLDTCGLDVVTTTSLLVARTVQQQFPEVEVRASVNMRLGTARAMDYVAEYFDSFTMQREYNRDLGRIAELKAWAEERGKALHFLANSGCLSWCSGQSFHDNLVAHEAQISETVNVSGWNPSVCWGYYSDPAHWVALLQSTWVRPEDLHHYEGLFPVAKLATRMHANPRKVIQAYCQGRFRGNLLDLFEPGHGPLLGRHVIDNTRFPEDWFQRTSECDQRCQACGYCAAVLERVLVEV